MYRFSLCPLERRGRVRSVRRGVDVVAHIQNGVSLVNKPLLSRPSLGMSAHRRIDRLRVAVESRRQIWWPLRSLRLLLLLWLLLLELLLLRSAPVLLECLLLELRHVVVGGVRRRRDRVVLRRDARVGAALEARRYSQSAGEGRCGT